MSKICAVFIPVPGVVRRHCPDKPITIEKIKKENRTATVETTTISRITKECVVKTKTEIVEKTESESTTEKDETIILCQTGWLLIGIDQTVKRKTVIVLKDELNYIPSP